MSPRLEQIVVFLEVSVLVALFTWIYIRKPQQRVRLWMLGWISILIHFAVPFLANSWFPGPNWIEFIRVGTLEVAGVSFVLSVSQVYTSTRGRILYFFLFGFPSLMYLACEIWSPEHKWVFPTLVIGSTAALLGNSWRYYRGRSFSFALLLGAPGIFALWSGVQSVRNPDIGLLYYLTTYFIVAGLLYIQYHKRVTPGVITTSVSFVLWGLVFPASMILSSYHMGPPGTSAFWDLPKYMVALGMILTLLENETFAANRAAHQYRKLFEGNLAAVYLSTREGKLLDCNAAFVNMYGYSSREEMLTRSTNALYMDPADRKEFLRRLTDAGQVINYECRQRKKDGLDLWILERATIVQDPSGQQMIEGTAIDITERKLTEIALKESEERFATIFHHSPVGCGIVSLEGIFLNGNAALGKMLGRPAEEIAGKTGVELGIWKSQDDRDQFYRRLRDEGSIDNMEIEFVDATGNKHIGLYFGRLVRIADRECIFGMQLDCTEQRELEAKFLQAQKMEAVGRLAGGVAHDFNNLLNVLGGYAELLELQLPRDENLRSYCRKILHTTQRASSLTSQLLTFSRKAVSKPVPLDPNQAIRELVEILLQPIIGPNIEIILTLEARGAVVIDKSHFEQIIFNIVVNARDAMPEGGELTITTKDSFDPLTTSDDTAPSKHVDIHIRDTGIGMDEATRQRAFEPFFTTKDVGRGTGLGLATVYGIVHQRGGEISINSRRNEGTQINISLPAAERAGTLEQKDLPMQVIRGSGHLLVVEDEELLRNVHSEYLTAAGYSVTCAHNGPEALELLEQLGPIDLVISDVVMPKMNGTELADRLLQIRPDTKLLFISGFADDVVLRNGNSKAAIPFLQKPYSLQVLLAKIHELLTADDTTLANGD